MKVFLTGATGYVGMAILHKLIENGNQVYCLVRSSSLSKFRLLTQSVTTELTAGSIHEVPGDLLTAITYEAVLQQCDAVIHLVGLIREFPSQGITFQQVHVEGTKLLIEACKLANIKKFIHMSALGARDAAVSSYHRTKYETEVIVRESAIPYFIFQPSIIFGPNDEFVNMLAGLIKLPLTPVIGDGHYRLQPVSLHTVVDIFVKSLHHVPANRTFQIGGPDLLSYNDMIKRIASTMNKRVQLFHLPLWLMKPIINALERFSFFPITNNQLTMLLEENICRDGNDVIDEFEITEVSFSEGIKRYLSHVSN